MAVTVTMPQLGETVTEGTILSWAKQVGDTVAVDEVLVEISTDKVDTEMPSPVAGVIKEILVPEGETVSVGTEIAIIADAAEEPGESAAQAETPSMPSEPQAPTEPAPVGASQGPTGGDDVWLQQGPTGTERPAPAPSPPVAAATVLTDAAPPPVGDGSRRGLLSPVVRKIATENGIDLDQVAGTGEGGRITRRDVEAHLAAGGAAVPVTVEDAETTKVMVEEREREPVVSVAVESQAEATVPAAQTGEVPMPKIRKTTAEHMVASKQISAHVWTSVEVDFERVAQIRARQGTEFKAAEGFSLTYLPFIASATIDALHAFPVVNSSFDLEAETVTYHTGVDLGIAVDLNQQGLIVLTIPEADGASLTGLARDIRGIAERARDGHMKPSDLGTSTFTITNPGPFGSYMSAPIINQPNVAILSTDTVVKRPTVVTLPDDTDVVAIRHIGYLGLTWDHRAFDGSTAVLFLARIKHNIETWDWEQELR
jgi:pyruvate dehydrogenase E2 component (dihydrolipoyllysine-residue acetyltransferase)